MSNLQPRSVGGVSVNGYSQRSGTWLPLDPASATPEEKTKIQETKAEEIKRLMARKQKLAGTPVDRDALQQQVAQAGEVALSDVEQRSVDYGYRALKRHHGPEVLQRLTQLIQGLSARMEKQPGDEHLKRKMAAYGYMLGRANTDFPPETKESNAPPQ